MLGILHKPICILLGVLQLKRVGDMPAEFISLIVEVLLQQDKQAIASLTVEEETIYSGKPLSCPGFVCIFSFGEGVGLLTKV